MERADRNRRAAIGTQARACVTMILLACCPCAFALDPTLDISQYAHNAWTIRDGFFKGVIRSIAQTADGYLWLGTEFGLLRFDGVRAIPWTPPGAARLPAGGITHLLVARNGTLWIGTFTGLASWNGAQLARYPDLDRQLVLSLLEDTEGTVWAGGVGVPTGRLCAIGGGRTLCYGQDGSVGRGVSSLYEENGNLWAGAATALWRWRPGPPTRYPMPQMGELLDLNRSDDGQLLIVMHRGIRELINGRAEPYPIRGAREPFNFARMLRDRNGALWIGTVDHGLVHIHQGRTDLFSRSDGLSGDVTESLFEDREGNVWVATDGGLDRFRDFTASTVSVKQGLSTDNVWSVLAGRDGSIWMGSRDGLNRWNHGQITIYRKGSGLPDDAPESLFQDNEGRIWAYTSHGLTYFEDGRFVPASTVISGQVHSIAGDKVGNLWLAEEQGLLRLRGERLVEQVPLSRLGHKEIVLNLLAEPEQGGLWLGFGFGGGGVTYFKDGQIRESYSAADGLGGGMILDLQLDREGTLWAATEHGLSRIKDRRVTTFTSKSGLPCDTVHWTMEDDDHSFWVYTACGLMRVARTEWDRWVVDPSRTMQATVFDNSDGVTLAATNISGYGPRVAKATDGKLWFVKSEGGVQVVDPRHLPFNKLPPPVHIEEVKVDGIPWDASHGWRLPALTRDLEIRYTALSLVAPEKNRFKYKLEGRDSDWKDAGNERKASYTDLPPRNYRFRVMASNNNGVWNEAGDSLDFSIAPAYYQTTWFQASLAGAFFILLWGLYRYRIYQMSREFNANLEGRVDERLRVARDLHDTLLQSFQGSLLRFQAAYNQVPAHAAEARNTLEGAIDQAAQAVTEGRDAIQGLRSSATETNELADALKALGEDLAAHQNNGGGVESFVEVEGTPRNLHPILRDEIYRIAGEAMRNAFKHSDARRIEVAIAYGDRQFRVRVRDNGKGIDPEIFADHGRRGHYGLPGMRERAELIGGRLEVWSELQSGTEIELTIPASIAYATSRRRLGSFLKKS